MFRLGTRNWPPVSHDLGQALTLLLSHFTKSLRHSMPHSNAQPQRRWDRSRLDSNASGPRTAPRQFMHSNRSRQGDYRSGVRISAKFVVFFVV